VYEECNMMIREQIIECLRQLGEELAVQNLHGELLLTGGAAMCLVHEARDMTKDIDALYEPKAIINSIAAKIAERNNLPKDWLNNKFTMHIPIAVGNAEATKMVTEFYEGSYQKGWILASSLKKSFNGLKTG